jgi:hypothetical protein
MEVMSYAKAASMSKEGGPEMMMMWLLWGDLVEAEEQRLEPRAATEH